LVQAKKKLLGYSVQNKEQTQPCLCSRWLSTPACRSYDATAASATAGGLFAPGGLTVGRTRRVAIAASVNMESSVHLVIIQGEVGSREERKASIPFPTATYREPSTLKCRSCACRCRHGRRRLRSGPGGPSAARSGSVGSTRRDRSEPTQPSTPTCRSCAATAASDTADGGSAPDGRLPRQTEGPHETRRLLRHDCLP
jgi:hypothetical protein